MATNYRQRRPDTGPRITPAAVAAFRAAAWTELHRLLGLLGGACVGRYWRCTNSSKTWSGIITNSVMSTRNDTGNSSIWPRNTHGLPFSQKISFTSSAARSKASRLRSDVSTRTAKNQPRLQFGHELSSWRRITLIGVI